MVTSVFFCRFSCSPLRLLSVWGRHLNISTLICFGQRIAILHGVSSELSYTKYSLWELSGESSSKQG